jgi:hypothetical protein
MDSLTLPLQRLSKQQTQQPLLSDAASSQYSPPTAAHLLCNDVGPADHHPPLGQLCRGGNWQWLC